MPFYGAFLSETFCLCLSGLPPPVTAFIVYTNNVRKYEQITLFMENYLVRLPDYGLLNELLMAFAEIVIQVKHEKNSTLPNIYTK